MAANLCCIMNSSSGGGISRARIALFLSASLLFFRVARSSPPPPPPASPGCWYLIFPNWPQQGGAIVVRAGRQYKQPLSGAANYCCVSSSGGAQFLPSSVSIFLPIFVSLFASLLFSSLRLGSHGGRQFLRPLAVVSSRGATAIERGR